MDRVAVTGHGRATIVVPSDEEFAAVDATYDARWWSPYRDARQGVYLRIDLSQLFTWTADPSTFGS
jgi:hypothetical protein